MRNNAKSARGKSSAARPVLDQGIAITGELLVQLFGLRVLPIKIRLLVSNKELAAELGLDWWNDERATSSRGKKRSSQRSTSAPASVVARRAPGGNGSRGSVSK